MFILIFEINFSSFFLDGTGQILFFLNNQWISVFYKVCSELGHVTSKTAHICYVELFNTNRFLKNYIENAQQLLNLSTVMLVGRATLKNVKTMNAQKCCENVFVNVIYI